MRPWLYSRFTAIFDRSGDLQSRWKRDRALSRVVFSVGWLVEQWLPSALESCGDFPRINSVREMPSIDLLMALRSAEFGNILSVRYYREFLNSSGTESARLARSWRASFPRSFVELVTLPPFGRSEFLSMSISSGTVDFNQAIMPN